ncbi:Fpg/Nei family DNA glycosylase [Methanobacterium sp. BAmetb5]|jgi:formamidopyrimidine-DNA glycosylase|uniref:Fpg/Nei family DNA glycosylase n=1 Tax=Methanobacterium sp. BAmetb5 TaxID=2025351 RepID=UPI000E8385F4|nr:DNA-formamidopyrimidine glycosylase family protein [Methanobacterium sp. BAmetb5]AXV40778.1 MAG: formamidopyrimidine-DNA glycosylase [Methanobacterium sp. BAmetb5]
MPELPTLEIYKKYFDETSLHQTINSVRVVSPEVLVETSSEEIKETLLGHEFIQSRRYGKYLFSQLDNGLFLIMHFGMTGFLHYGSVDGSRYPRLLIEFSTGKFLSFDDARKFGKLGLTRHPDEFIKEKKLGPDALEINFKNFKEIFKNKKGMIKPLLLNQHVLAGIGNLYADEILYQSRVHPLTPAHMLDKEEWEQLFKDMKRVLQKAIEYQDKPEALPESYLLPHRHQGGKCPEGDQLNIIQVGGRTTYFCPQRQKIKH